MKTFRIRFVYLIVPVTLLLGILTFIAGAASASQMSGNDPAAMPLATESNAPLDTPETVISEDYFNVWTVGGGFLYWGRRCFPGPDAAPQGGVDDYYLRRRPIDGGTTITLTVVTSETCETFAGMTADDSGVYYYNDHDGRIEMIPVDAPNEPPRILHTTSNVRSDLALDENYVYWGTDSSVARAAKDGSGAQPVALTSERVQDLVVDFASVYWLTQEGLYWADKLCNAQVCTGEQLSGFGGRHPIIVGPGFAGEPQPVYWVEDNIPGVAPDRILRLFCTSTFGCGAQVVHTAPDGWSIGQIVAGGETSPFGPSSLFWIEKDSPNNGRLRRIAISGDTPEDLLVNRPSLSLLNLFANDRYLYFSDDLNLSSARISRLPFDASAVTRDLAADVWEVTQAIQNLANDVPLVANKKTFVRVFGQQLEGPPVNSANAYLYGERNGTPLPGSPLKPVNGTMPLGVLSGFQRGSLDRSWLFELPDNWTNPGALSLSAVVDAQGVYPDSNGGNNTLSDTFTFTRKDLLCLEMVWVVTDPQTATTNDPGFWDIIDWLKAVYPISEVDIKPGGRIEELEFCGIIPCNGPYEIPSDASKALYNLWVYNLLTNDPDKCNDQVYYYGMVHPSETPYYGVAFRPGDEALGVMSVDPYVLGVSWPSWYIPAGGLIMSHEVGHNLGRKHVDCGGPGSTDGDYPYDECDLGPDEDTAYYGFNTRTTTVIAPTSAADLMSYSHNNDKPQWISDYTYRALFDKLPNAARPVPSTSALVRQVIGAEEALAVTGVVTPTASTATLGYTYRLPQGLVNTHKLARLASRIPTGPNAPYTLRLLDASEQVLVDQSFELPELSDHDSVSYPLNWLVPFDTAAAYIVLYQNGDEIARRAISQSSPTVQVLSPNGGEEVSGSLTIAWNAADSDGDSLLYTVQYSPDGGSEWQTLAANHIAQTLVVDDLTLLPGSDSALIRVMASDGANTGMDVSDQTFKVAAHPPQPTIVAPHANAFLAATAPVRLSGRALDAEDGVLAGEALHWTVDGQDRGSGEDLWIEGLAPGAHQVTLLARDSDGQEETAVASFTLATLSIPSGNVPTVDGFCDDSAYLNGTSLQLAPYANGDQATVYLLRSESDLWVCFSGLQRGDGRAGLHVDVDNSRDATVQADDYGFFIAENGTPSAMTGGNTAELEGYQARVSANQAAWHAELRISADLLNGWDHIVGLDLVHSDADEYHWPFAASSDRPDTWARTALGKLPQLFLPFIVNELPTAAG